MSSGPEERLQPKEEEEEEEEGRESFCPLMLEELRRHEGEEEEEEEADEAIAIAIAIASKEIDDKGEKERVRDRLLFVAFFF